jgi:hypothetical protein
MDLTDILVDILIDKMEYNLKMKPQPVRIVQLVDDFQVALRKDKTTIEEPPKKKRKITYSMSM